VATIYLHKNIQLSENEENKALDIAKIEFVKLYQELTLLVPIFQEEVKQKNPYLIVEAIEFDFDSIICEDWDDGEWYVSYSFEISCKSPDGIAELDFDYSAYDVWDDLGKPLYKDIFEPLYQCNWDAFKRDDVTVEFQAVNVVHSYKHDGFHFYDNRRWL